MSEPIEQLTRTLRSHGYSLTKPRQIVFDVLQGQEPLTMRALANRCHDIDRASVYRTVGLFEQLDIVQRLQIGWKYKLELAGEFVHHHHHATCSYCGRIIPLPEDILLERRLQTMAQAQGFSLRSHQLELNGLCAQCQTAGVKLP